MQAPLMIGADVAKDEVVLACSAKTFAVKTVANTPAALRAFLKTLPAGSAVAMESTGRYHERLAELAAQLGHVVYLLNPKDTYYYAKAMGLRAKTDRVDAALIARYLAHEASHLRPYAAPTPAQRQIDLLLRRRARIASLKAALQLTCRDMASLQKGLRASLASLTALSDEIDRQIADLAQAIAGRVEQVQRLQSVTGIGILTASWLANLLDRVPFANSDALVAFTGLDPRPCDSGHKRGRRRLSKRGPAEGRRLLFNAAMSAIKNPAWRTVYEHHREHGWPTTAALMIIARKLLRIAFALYKTKTTFNLALITLKT